MLGSRRYSCKCIRDVEVDKYNVHLINVTAPYPCRECDSVAYSRGTASESKAQLNKSFQDLFSQLF